MGKIKQPDPLAGINRKVARWKETHVAQVQAELDNDEARADVKESLTKAGVEHVITPTGTIALQNRAGATKVDWESLARKYVPPDTLETVLPAFTTVGAPAVVLAAPKEWSIEAKASREK